MQHRGRGLEATGSDHGIEALQIVQGGLVNVSFAYKDCAIFVISLWIDRKYYWFHGIRRCMSKSLGGDCGEVALLPVNLLSTGSIPIHRHSSRNARSRSACLVRVAPRIYRSSFKALKNGIKRKGAFQMKDLSIFTTGDGCQIAYRFDGAGDKPVLVLSNSIATTLNMWDAQIQGLSKHFRILRYDTRGHGASGVPAGAYSIDRLGRDVIELLDALQISRVHFCGLSLGGVVGQWLGIHVPEKIDRLILCNTSSYLGSADQWDELIASVLQAKDMSETAEMFLGNWFPSRMLDEERAIIGSFRSMVLATHPQGLAGCLAAIRDMDLRRTIALITRPTLVIAGQYDTVTLASHSELIARTVQGSKLTVLPAVHMSNVEYPADFLNAVLEFLLAD
jgi:3-oxoadipate enol-lactonase